MDDPGGSVVSTQSVGSQPKEASLAGESEVLRYLYMCFKRLKNTESDKQVCIYLFFFVFALHCISSRGYCLFLIYHKNIPLEACC